MTSEIDSTSAPSLLSDLRSSLDRDSSGIPILKFYWLDAISDVNEPGTVHLFGKIYLRSSGIYVSTCLTVENIPRRVYVLPKEGRSISEVQEEFRRLANCLKIQEFKSRVVTKKYAFEIPGIPWKAEYLEVTYSAKFPQLLRTANGQAIAHIFETSISTMELLLTDREIKGPCWLEIKSPRLVEAWRNASWCKYQVICYDFKNIFLHNGEEDLEIPPLIVTVINVKTSADEKESNHEIIMISLHTLNNFKIDKPREQSENQEIQCFVTKPCKLSWPENAEDDLNACDMKIIKCEREGILLENFLEELKNIDPDIVIGYDCGFQFNMIIRRSLALKTHDTSRLSKLRRDLVPQQRTKFMLHQIFCRPIADLKLTIKEFCPEIRHTDLDSLCSTVLKTRIGHIRDINSSMCPEFYTSSKKLIELVRSIGNEAGSLLDLVCETNIIAVAMEMTAIVGNNLSRTLSANKNERNEFLLLHGFSRRGFILPDRRNLRDNQEAFTGGLILTPKIGFYGEYVLLMDFVSLYPNIILEYNLCFSTIRGVCYRPMNDLELPKLSTKTGVLSSEIGKIVDSRNEVKELLKNPDLSSDLKLQYYIRQRALKLTANSIYGCLGSMHFRFYARNLAAIIAGQGRAILLGAKEVVEQKDFNVIYGDTDSLMIDTKTKSYEDAVRIAEEIKQEVNKQYRNIKLDVDGIYKHFLVVGTQQYTGVLAKKLSDGTLEFTTDLKLMEFMRSDWCKLARDTGIYVTERILMDIPMEEKVESIRKYLSTLAEKVEGKKFDSLIPSLIITNKLAKNPEQYADGTFPHVTLAKRLNRESAAGNRRWRAGQFVPYIICDDGTHRPPGQRSYLVSERRRYNINPDMTYYFLQQVIRGIRRVCEPLPELNGEFLAKCLGIDEEYRKLVGGRVRRSVMELFQSEGHELFSFTCRNCGLKNEVLEFMTIIKKKRIPFLEGCTGVECRVPPWHYIKDILAELEGFVRGLMPGYRMGMRISCMNGGCEFVSDNLALEKSTCPRCRKSILEKESLLPIIYGKLKFLRRCFDADAQSDKVRDGLSSFVIQAYDAMKEVVQKYMNLMPYATIDLDEIPW